MLVCCCAPLAADDAAAALLLPLSMRWPDTRYLIVVQGASSVSSWSIPQVLAPFLLSTPTTLNDTFCTRISLPTGDTPPNSSLTTVWPRRQTRLALRTSRSVKDSPSVRLVHSRTLRYSGVVPLMFCGTQFLLP